MYVPTYTNAFEGKLQKNLIALEKLLERVQT